MRVVDHPERLWSSNLGDTKNLAGYTSGQPAVAAPAQPGFGLDNLQQPLPTSTILLFCANYYASHLFQQEEMQRVDIHQAQITNLSGVMVLLTSWQAEQDYKGRNLSLFSCRKKLKMCAVLQSNPECLYCH